MFWFADHAIAWNSMFFLTNNGYSMEFSCFGLLSMTIKEWVLGFPCFVLLAIHSMEFPCYGIVAMTFISWNSMFSLTGNSLKFTCVLFSDHHDNSMEFPCFGLLHGHDIAWDIPMP